MASFLASTGALVVLAVIATSGTPARSDLAHNMVIGVTPESSFTVNIEGTSLPFLVRSEDLGLLSFTFDPGEFPPGPLTVEIQSSGCDSSEFVICPGQCGVRPREVTP